MPVFTSLRLKCFVKIQKVYYKKIENISCFVNWNYHGEKFATWRGFNEIIKVLQIFVLSFYIFYLSFSNYKLQLDYFIIIIYYSKNWLFRCFILPNRPYALATLTAWKVSKYGPEKTPYLDLFHAVTMNPAIDTWSIITHVYHFCNSKFRVCQIPKPFLFITFIQIT